MRIQRSDRIAGIPVLALRALLREFGDRFLNARDAAMELKIPQGDAYRKLARLCALGYVKRQAKGSWTVTPKGSQLGLATAARPVTRATAVQAVEQLLMRVRDINADDYFLYKIADVVVFGSYLEKTDRLGDVDVAVRLQPRHKDHDVRMRLTEERATAAEREGRRFGNLVDRLGWPWTEVWLYLKAGSRTLSIHDADRDRVLRETASKRIYRLADQPPPSPSECEQAVARREAFQNRRRQRRDARWTRRSSAGTQKYARVDKRVVRESTPIGRFLTLRDVWLDRLDRVVARSGHPVIPPSCKTLRELRDEVARHSESLKAALQKPIIDEKDLPVWDPE